jgi:hypothetical protein
VTPEQREAAERAAQDFADCLVAWKTPARTPVAWEALSHEQVRHAYLTLSRLGIRESQFNGFYEVKPAPLAQHESATTVADSGLPLVDSITPKLELPLPRASYNPGIPQLDITKPDFDITIEIDEPRGVMYIHVGPVTVLRICQVKKFIVLTHH